MHETVGCNSDDKAMVKITNISFAVNHLYVIGPESTVKCPVIPGEGICPSMTVLRLQGAVNIRNWYSTFGEICIVISACQAKVDNIVGAECLYYGDRMIQSIDQSFYPTGKV